VSPTTTADSKAHSPESATRETAESCASPSTSRPPLLEANDCRSQQRKWGIHVEIPRIDSDDARHNVGQLSSESTVEQRSPVGQTSSNVGQLSSFFTRGSMPPELRRDICSPNTIFKSLGDEEEAGGEGGAGKVGGTKRKDECAAGKGTVEVVTALRALNDMLNQGSLSQDEYQVPGKGVGMIYVIYIYISICVYIYMYIYICIYIYIYICINIYIHVCMYVCVYTHTHTHTYIHSCVCVCVCVLCACVCCLIYIIHILPIYKLVYDAFHI